jgi:hypothetical protein
LFLLSYLTRIYFFFLWSCPCIRGGVLVAWGGIPVAVDVAVAVEPFLWRGELSLQPWRAVSEALELSLWLEEVSL